MSSAMGSFWGLHLTRGLQYSRVVRESFHISSATLDLSSGYKGGVISVMFEEGDQEFVLCNLSAEHHLLQVPLDLQFWEGDRISFTLRGPPGDVYLTGYNLMPETIEEEGEEEESEDEEVPQLVDKKRKRESGEKSGSKKTKLEKFTETKIEKPEKNKLPKKESKQVEKAQSNSSAKKDEQPLKNKTQNSVKKSEKPQKTLVELMNGADEDSEEEDEEFTMDGIEEESDDEVEEEEEDDDDDDDGEEEEEEDEDEEDDDDDEEDEEEEEEEEESSDEETDAKEKSNKFSSPEKKSVLSSVTPSSAGKTPMVMSKEKKKRQKQQQQQSPNLNKTPKEDKSKTPTATKENSLETPKSKKKKGQNKENEKTPNNLNTSINTASSVSPGKKSIKQGGVICEDIVLGNGTEAKHGKMVAVYYEGKLKNGKVFDKTVSGPPFHFRLGSGEVIKGWDVALQGMKVGGKRRFTTPPAMAYGKKGAPPAIPPNSFLNFEVELKSVK